MISQVAALLNAHQAADEDEARDISTIKRLLTEEPNLFSRDCAIGHITASALVVDAATGRALLHYHKRLNRWLQVGGHLDGETDPAAAALREAREETGLPDLAFFPDARPLDIDAHVIPQSDGEPQHLHFDFRYLLLTRQPDRLNPSAGESRRFRWLSFDEALSQADEMNAALGRLLRKGRRIAERVSVTR